MESKNQKNVAWRLTIPRRDISEILLISDGPLFSLPVVKIPAFQRIAEALNAEIKRRWGLEVISLFPLDPSNRSGEHCSRPCHIVETLRPDSQPPDGMFWTPIAALHEDCFGRREDFLAIRQLVSTCERTQTPAEPFARPGWFKEITQWVQDSIHSMGHRLTGRVRQLNASPSFSLIQFATNEDPVWFKAVGAPRLAEFPITLALASLFPHCVPTIINTSNRWNAWLMKDAPGTRLLGSTDFRLWEMTAVHLADLQIASIGKTAQIVEAGAMDLCPSQLRFRVRGFFETTAELMKQQRRTSPAALADAALLELQGELEEALTAAERLAFSPVVGHLDFNPGNIIVSNQNCVFLDWAEAFVGPPFLTFEYFLQHFRHAWPHDSALEQRLTQLYCQRWRSILAPDSIREALDLAPLLAAFAFATNLDVSPNRSLPGDSPEKAYLRSLTRRMYREAEKLQSGRIKCAV